MIKACTWTDEKKGTTHLGVILSTRVSEASRPDRVRHLAYTWRWKRAWQTTHFFLPKKKTLSICYVSFLDTNVWIAIRALATEKTLVTWRVGSARTPVLLARFQKRRCSARIIRYTTTSGGARLCLYLYRDSTLSLSCFNNASSAERNFRPIHKQRCQLSSTGLSGWSKKNFFILQKSRPFFLHLLELWFFMSVMFVYQRTDDWARHNLCMERCQKWRDCYYKR